MEYNYKVWRFRCHMCQRQVVDKTFTLNSEIKMIKLGCHGCHTKQDCILFSSLYKRHFHMMENNDKYGFKYKIENTNQTV
jgi:hypothetical protein